MIRLDISNAFLLPAPTTSGSGAGSLQGTLVSPHDPEVPTVLLPVQTHQPTQLGEARKHIIVPGTHFLLPLSWQSSDP
jgi:hypothetical protein